MTQSEKQRWEKIRSKGRTCYIVSFGILRIGIISGVIFSLLPYEFGMVTHAYTMSVWMLMLLIIILTLVFTFGFGCLFWHLNEKNFQIPTTDDHIPNLQSITKAELSSISRKIGKRQTYRKLLALPVLVFVFGGLSLVPHSSPYHDYYIWSIAIIAWILLILAIRFIIRGTKADCYEFGAICPKCNKPLYSGSGIRNGRYPNCGYQLFDDAAVK